MDLRMIDFAHVQRNDKEGEIDEGYVTGLKSLLSLFQALKKRFRAKKGKNNAFNSL